MINEMTIRNFSIWTLVFLLRSGCFDFSFAANEAQGTKETRHPDSQRRRVTCMRHLSEGFWAIPVRHTNRIVQQEN